MKNKNTANNFDDLNKKVYDFADTCEFVKADPKIKVQKPKDIMEQVESLDASKIAEEVLMWLTKNVENFISNQTKEFKIDIVLDQESETVYEMEELKKLQDIYQSLPDSCSASVNNARNKLDEITEEAFDAMGTKTEMLQSLFKRMAFYYELRGISRGTQLIQELEGNVSITKFEYDPFSIGVKVRKMEVAQNEDGGERVISDKHVITEYVVPEGFSLWLEIAFIPKVLPKGMF